MTVNPMVSLYPRLLGQNAFYMLAHLFDWNGKIKTLALSDSHRGNTDHLAIFIEQGAT